MYQNRRQFLASTAAVVSASALGGASTTATAAAGYDVVEGNGQTIRVGEGETYENKLIDMTNGDGVTILIEGGDSTVRNIGYKGMYTGNNFAIVLTAPSGEVLIENIYLGDGADKTSYSFAHGPGGVFYHKKAGCDVTFRYMNVQGFTNNGFYCSNTPDGGNVHWDSCLGKNNGVSTFRCAAEGDVIENCVAYNDDTDYGDNYNTSWVEANGRPVWVWGGGEVEIIDSEFAAGTYSGAIMFHNGGSATMKGGAYKGRAGSGLTEESVGSDPSLEPPECVPESPEDAASGGAGEYEGEIHPGRTFDDGQHSILFSGLGVDEGGDGEVPTTEYTLEVSGELIPSRHGNATVDRCMGLEEGDSSIENSVQDWKDAYAFTGEIKALEVDGPAEVYLNGDEIDPTNYDDPKDDESNTDDGSYTLDVSVTGNGSPVIGADVTVDKTETPGRTRRQTGSDGSAEFTQLESGEYDVTAESNGVSASKTVTLSSDTQLEFSLEIGDDSPDGGDDPDDGDEPDNGGDDPDGGDNPDNGDEPDGGDEPNNGGDDPDGGDNPDDGDEPTDPAPGDDMDNIVDNLFGDGGLFDSLFGDGGLFG